MAVIIKQDQLVMNVQSINGLAERISNIKWYENAGKEDKKAEELFQGFINNLKVSGVEFRWISKEEAKDTISKLDFRGSNLWEVLKVFPDQLKKKVDDLQREESLAKAVDILPEVVFHQAFEKAFRVFQHEKVVSFLTGHAMYIAVLAAASEIAGETALLTPLIEFLEAGHVPLGTEGNVVYLL